MKDKKILFLTLFALLLLLLILYLSLSRLVNTESARLKKTSDPLHSNTVRLEAQVNQLQEFLRSFIQLNLTMKNNLEGEKKQNSELKKVLDEISQQKEALSAELSRAGTSLELTEGLRKKLASLESSFSSIKLGPGREKEFKNQLRELGRGLDKINYQIPELIRENKNYKQEAKDLQAALDKKGKELSSLKPELEELSQTNRRLSQEIKSLKETRAGLEAKNREAEKLREELKQANSGLSSRLGGIEKDLGESREKLTRALKDNQILLKQKESYIARIRALEAWETEVSALKKQLEGLKQKNSGLIRELETVKANQLNAQRLQEELAGLQGRLGQVNNDYESLKSKTSSDEETLKQNALELGRRADRIITLTDRMSALEAGSNEIKSRFQEFEKDSAILRQENVALRLEKESLNSRLIQTEQKLSDMETRANQISSILSAPAQNQPPENKRIEVEVLQETTNENKQ